MWCVLCGVWRSYEGQCMLGLIVIIYIFVAAVNIHLQSFVRWILLHAMCLFIPPFSSLSLHCYSIRLSLSLCWHFLSGISLSSPFRSLIKLLASFFLSLSSFLPFFLLLSFLFVCYCTVIYKLCAYVCLFIQVSIQSILKHFQLQFIVLIKFKHLLLIIIIIVLFECLNRTDSPRL